jgi:small conductance mechanosensitive channel
MRVLLLLAALTLAAPAAAQTTLTVHQTAPAAATPAKAAAGAIIPGSPLAALTGVAAPADPDAATPAPVGATDFGLSLIDNAGSTLAHSFGDITDAVRQSTALTPVAEWLRSFASIPTRRAHAADAVMALAIAILPALAVEALLRLALTRPRAAITRAAPPQDDPAPALDAAEAGDLEPRRHLLPAFFARRILFALLRFALLLVPLAGFAVTIPVIVATGLITSRDGHLAVDTVGNAYVIFRTLLLLLALLFAPETPALRLVTLSSSGAAKLFWWLRLIIATALAGYVVVTLAEILALSHDGALAVLRLMALAAHLELAAAIWLGRKPIGRWLAGDAGATGTWAVTRQRLGHNWYIPALFYVLALWIALAAGIHNAFGLLLRVIVVVIAAGVLGRLAWAGSSKLLERSFPDAADGQTLRHPELAARARAYNPLIRFLFRVLTFAILLVLVLQGWGFDAFGFLAANPVSRSLISAFISIIITIAIALIFWEYCNAWLNRRIESLAEGGQSRQASRLKTLSPMFKAAIAVVTAGVTLYLCLSRLGVNVAPVAAVAGVVGIAVGFGSQKLVQDIITGLFILMEDAMQVGDVVTVAGMTGTVERLSIRTIRLRGGDGSVNIIPFSSVTTVTNMTRDFGYAQISIQVAYDADLNHVYAVLADISKTMRMEPDWAAKMRDDLQLFGLDEFGASALVITGQIRTGPGQQWPVRREFYARVKRRFAKEHIEIPYTYLAPAPAPPAAPAAALDTALAAPPQDDPQQSS